MSSEHVTKPRYEKIAIDIANKIVAGELSVGDKVYGRSSLASHYNVSPETIRRSMILLKDMDIVEVEKGSGIFIKSVDNCLKFINKFKDISSMNSLKKEMLDLLHEKNNLEKKIQGVVNELVDSSNRFTDNNPFVPFEFKIYNGLDIIGKTISEIKFWQNTGSTIVGIKRNGKLILSPGPYAAFEENDVFIAVGGEESYCRIKNFVYNE
ncbi:TrkA C-terminal domain-containing protein [Clostridium sp. BJN0001]|uniref:GntR family transcriptional regulator n=1 Tax=Clostridium sp. BJN0001 TaxID=2930219 RepID=UPI001FCFFC11|nr:TrkA C-terminal domain-containing protein [Clostridium sp. BJN0001]